MTTGKIRINTLAKFLRLCSLTKQRRRILTVDEIIQEFHHSRSHSYNYQRALKQLFPPGSFDPDIPPEGNQRCLM